MTEIRTFAAGEVAPQLYGRVDVDRWRSALKACRNWIVLPEGGITARPGYEITAQSPPWVTATPASSRMIPFEYSPTDTHVLRITGDQMTVITNNVEQRGWPVQHDAKLYFITPWNVITTTPHGLTTNDTIVMSAPDAATYTVTVVSPTQFTLNGTVTTGAASQVVGYRKTNNAPSTLTYTLPHTPNLGALRWVQSGDTLYMTDGAMPPLRIVRENYANLSRAASFRIAAAPMTPSIVWGYAISASGGTGTTPSRYQVTYTTKDGVESAIIRSAQGMGTLSLVGSEWNAYTAAPHGMQSNDTIICDTLVQSTESSGYTYVRGDAIRIRRIDANNFRIGGTGVAPYTISMFYYKTGVTLNTSPTSASPITVTWPAVSGAGYYNVYREYGRWFSYIGSTADLSFVDNGIVPDAKDNALRGKSPIAEYAPALYDNPLAVGLFQQRLMYGGFIRDSERIVGSAVGNYSSFDVTAEDAGAIDFGLAGRTVSSVKHMLEIAGRAVVLTDTCEWVLRGGTSGGLTPTSVNARADSYHGTTDTVPAVVGSNLLYVQRGGKILRDAQYDYSQEALSSRDLTLWARHMFNSEIIRIAYQRTEGVVWVLLKSGQLLGLTYLPDQEVWGWHRHDVPNSIVTDIAVVSEPYSIPGGHPVTLDGGPRDRLYIMTHTPVAASGHMAFGRLGLWETPLAAVDNFVGRDKTYALNRTVSGLGTLTGGTNWTTSETLTLTSTASNFSPGLVGKVIGLFKGDERVYLEVTAYTSGTVVSAKPMTVVPLSLRGIRSDSMGYSNATGPAWTETIDFTGSVYAEAWNGQTLRGLLDGSVVDLTLSSGSVTLPFPAVRVQIGVPITSRAETLELQSTDKDSLMGDFRHITKVRLRAVASRGLKAGLSESTLEPVIPEFDALSNAPPGLKTGVKDIIMDSAHDEDGSIIIAQDDGLPATVTGVRVLFNEGTVA